jgi:hypothetical protein
MWHKLRRDMGMQHDSELILDSSNFSFNSQADLVRSEKKPIVDDELILNRLNRRHQPFERLDAELQPVAEETEHNTPDRPKESAVARKNRLNQLTKMEAFLTSEYVVSDNTRKRMDAFYNADNPSMTQTIIE